MVLGLLWKRKKKATSRKIQKQKNRRDNQLHTRINKKIDCPLNDTLMWKNV